MSKQINNSENILLLGNGINLLSTNLDWKRLMNKLIRETLERETINFEAKPLPLLYEEIAFKLCDKSGCVDISGIEKVLKEKIASIFNRKSKNGEGRGAFEKLLEGIKVSHFLTTNYDYNIEKYLENASVNARQKANLSRERKYNLFRRNKVGDKFVWHIHGETDQPSSITLGYEHYAGQLQKMRNYCTGGVSSRRSKREEKLSSLVIGAKNYKDFMRKMGDCERGAIPYSWIDLFLSHDVHIIGFSLDYNEIDLWWLMLHKERERRKERKRWLGRTYFYYFESGEMDRDMQSGKLSLLESYGIIVRKYSLKEGYPEAYEKIFRDFKRQSRD